MEVSGIGEAKYAELEDRITVGDADNDDGGDTADEDPGGSMTRSCWSRA